MARIMRKDNGTEFDSKASIIIKMADRFGSIIFALGFSYILLTQTLPSQRQDFVDALEKQQASFEKTVAQFDQILKDQRQANADQVKAERDTFERMFRESSGGKLDYSGPQ